MSTTENTTENTCVETQETPETQQTQEIEYDPTQLFSQIRKSNVSWTEYSSKANFANLLIAFFYTVHRENSDQSRDYLAELLQPFLGQLEYVFQEYYTQEGRNGDLFYEVFFTSPERRNNNNKQEIQLREAANRKLDVFLMTLIRRARYNLRYLERGGSVGVNWEYQNDFYQDFKKAIDFLGEQEFDEIEKEVTNRNGTTSTKTIRISREPLYEGFKVKLREFDEVRNVENYKRKISSAQDGTRQPRQPRQPRTQRNPRDSKEPREPREPKEPREPREPRGPREPREPRESNKSTKINERDFQPLPQKKKRSENKTTSSPKKESTNMYSDLDQQTVQTE